MALAMIDNRRIYYETHGQGDTIVLLHQGFACSRMWEYIYPDLVDQGYRVVMYDRRGFGRSEPGPGFNEFYVSDGYRSESVSELAALKDFLGLDSFHLVAQCEGGVIGLDYAVKHPGQVKTIVTASTPCYTEITMLEFSQANFPPFKELEPELQDKIRYWHGEERAEFIFNLIRLGGGAYGQGVFDLRETLPLVTCPVLVLYPDRSALVGVEQGVVFYRLLPEGELAVFPKCGHNSYDVHPGQYTRFILEFLERQGF